MTYWVSYSFKYKYLDELSGQWEEYEDFDSRRFSCKKKDIYKKVKEYVEQEIESETYKNLKITINDSYLTTDYEV